MRKSEDEWYDDKPMEKKWEIPHECEHGARETCTNGCSGSIFCEMVPLPNDTIDPLAMLWDAYKYCVSKSTSPRDKYDNASLVMIIAREHLKNPKLACLNSMTIFDSSNASYEDWA